MFVHFFYQLKAKKIPVSTGEFLDFIKAIKGLTQDRAVLSLEELYFIARNCLVKDLKYYDDYDQVFASIFSKLDLSDETFRSLLLDWLNNPIRKELSEEQIRSAPFMEYEELLKELEKRLQEQKERHDGGSYWIGTGGTSPFGNSGFNEQGIRIGGESSAKRAINSAKSRNYREYRTDESLNVRQIKMALKKLRILKKQGNPELSIDKSIDKTCKNCGELELVFERTRKNNLKLILLMDIGGSMTPYSYRVNRLFSASHQINHFKEFHYYYFHNIIYDHLYKDAQLSHRFPIDSILHKFREDTRIIFVGDALMNPYELFVQVDPEYYSYYGSNKSHRKSHKKPKTGIERLRDLKHHFPKIIWLNPEPMRFWGEPTIEAIETEVPMYFLSIEGIQRGIQYLV